MALPGVPPGKTAGQSLSSPYREGPERHPDTVAVKEVRPLAPGADVAAQCLADRNPSA